MEFFIFWNTGLLYSFSFSKPMPCFLVIPEKDSNLPPTVGLSNQSKLKKNNIPYQLKYKIITVIVAKINFYNLAYTMQAYFYVCQGQLSVFFHDYSSRPSQHVFSYSQLSSGGRDSLPLTVSTKGQYKSQKQIILFSFFPKNEQNPC